MSRQCMTIVRGVEHKVDLFLFVILYYKFLRQNYFDNLQLHGSNRYELMFAKVYCGTGTLNPCEICWLQENWRIFGKGGK